jgi:hypothetical protein
MVQIIAFVSEKCKSQNNKVAKNKNAKSKKVINGFKF